MATTTRFTIPRFTDRQLSDPVFSRMQINDLAARIQQRDAVLAERDKQVLTLSAQVTKQQVQLETAKADVAKRDTTITASNRQIADLLAKNADLLRQIETLTVNRPKIGVDQLVTQFTSSVERLNTEARTRGGTAFLVDDLQVEIKAGIDVSDGLRLSQLPDAAIGVDSVSTLRFALRPNAVIRAVDDEPAPP